MDICNTRGTAYALRLRALFTRFNGPHVIAEKEQCEREPSPLYILQVRGGNERDAHVVFVGQASRMWEWAVRSHFQFETRLRVWLSSRYIYNN